jgi:hypothetical protein
MQELSLSKRQDEVTAPLFSAATDTELFAIQACSPPPPAPPPHFPPPAPALPPRDRCAPTPPAPPGACMAETEETSGALPADPCVLLLLLSADACILLLLLSLPTDGNSLEPPTGTPPTCITGPTGQPMSELRVALYTYIIQICIHVYTQTHTHTYIYIHI